MKWLIITKEPATRALVEVHADQCDTTASGCLVLSRLVTRGKRVDYPLVCACFAPGTWITANAEDVAAEVSEIR